MQYFIAEDKLLVDYGPVQMTIKAKKGGRSVAEELWAAGEYVEKLLQQLAPLLQQAKAITVKGEDMSVRMDMSEKPEKWNMPEMPEVLSKMVAAVNATGVEGLTPMAAVAGTFSDMVADYLLAQDMDYVIVNNGGDVAIRGKGEYKLKVGIAQAIEANQYTHYLEVDAASGIGGVATSGFGGRSFTQGIATAAVVAAESCRVADAWATLLGNAAFFPDPAILQVPANQIDPDTDLQDTLITAKVGEISPLTVEQALTKAMDFAEKLVQAGKIKGAAVFYHDVYQCCPNNFVQQLGK